VIEINWTLFLQFANFIILMAVLNVLLFKPLRAALKQRQETIEGSRIKIQDLEEQVQAQVARYEAQLQEAKQNAAQERAALRHAAQQEESRMLAEARGLSADRLQSIKDKVAVEAETARQSLRGETEAIARQIAGKVLGREIG